MNCYFCSKILNKYDYCRDCLASTYYHDDELSFSIKMFDHFYLCYNFDTKNINAYTRSKGTKIMNFSINQNLATIELKIRMHLLFQ